MNQGKRFEVALAGEGGHGILFVGRLLAEAGAKRFQFATFTPNYASMMRGAPSEGLTILSDSEILCPSINKVDTAVLMAPRFFDEYVKRVKQGGSLLIDSSLQIPSINRSDVVVYQVPAFDLAAGLGDVRVANLVLLGSYLEITQAVPLETVEETLAKKSGAARVAYSINRKALDAGGSHVRSLRT